MKILLDKIETTGKINGLGLKRSVNKEHYEELYYDTDLGMYIVIRAEETGDSKYSGKILLERNQVRCAQVAHESVPVHQPIGTSPERDTPSGKKRKHRTDATAKSTLAERIEARAADKKSVD